MQNTVLNSRLEAILKVVQGFDKILLYHVNMLYSPIFAMGNAFGSFSISCFVPLAYKLMVKETQLYPPIDDEAPK